MTFHKSNTKIFALILFAFLLQALYLNAFAYSSNFETPILADNPELSLTASYSGKNVVLTWVYEPGFVPIGYINHNPYYIYRAEGNNPYTIPLMDFPVSELTYTDTKGDYGKTYRYVVKKLNADGSAGLTSNEVTIKIGFDKIKLKIGESFMYIDGRKVEIDPGRGTAPIIKDGRTLLPIRALVEEMGGKVAWNDTTRETTISLDGKTVVMTIGKIGYKVQGIDYIMDVAPEIIKERTMVPLRFSLNQFNYKVDYMVDKSIVIQKCKELY